MLVAVVLGSRDCSMCWESTTLVSEKCVCFLVQLLMRCVSCSFDCTLGLLNAHSQTSYWRVLGWKGQTRSMIFSYCSVFGLE